MFRRKGCGAGAGCLVALAAALCASPASAQSKVECDSLTPLRSSHTCSLNPIPNISATCGSESGTSPDFFSTYSFTGCRARVGAVAVKCGSEVHENRYAGDRLTGCALDLGAQHIVVGCQKHESRPFAGATGSDRTCGVTPLVACTTEEFRYVGVVDFKRSTCGRSPVIVTCYQASLPLPAEHYCELSIGPAADPLVQCRIDLIDRPAIVASATACLQALRP